LEEKEGLGRTENNCKMNDIGSVYPLFIIFLTYSQGRHTDVNEHEQKFVPQVY
jgi:hypothetical protein